MWAVLGALVANVLITILKFAAAFITGSSGMMAESFHSLADTNNQIFLLLGLRFYKRPATKKHPFGHGMERFFWSFIAAVFIFGVGATTGVASLRIFLGADPPCFSFRLGCCFWRGGGGGGGGGRSRLTSNT